MVSVIYSVYFLHILNGISLEKPFTVVLSVTQYYVLKVGFN